MTEIRSSPSGPLVSLDLEFIESETLLANPTDETALPVATTTSEALDFLTKELLGFLFDGTPQATITFGDNLDKLRTDPFTIICWYRTRVPGSSFMLVCKQDTNPTLLGYSFSVRPVGYAFRFAVNNGAGNAVNVDNTTVLHDTLLHQAVVSYDGSGNASGVRIYHDLTLVPNTVNGATVTGNPVNSFPLAIGARPVDGAIPPNGQILQTSMWSRVLSLAEISETNADGLPAEDLRATSMASSLEWWVGMTPETDTLTPNGFRDLSGNGIHGTADSGVDLDNTFDSLIVRRDDGWKLEHVDEVVFPSLGDAADMPMFFVSVQGGNLTASFLFNVASITETGTGRVGINLGRAFTSTNYAVIGSVQSNSLTVNRSCTVANKLAGSFELFSVLEGGSGSEPTFWYAAGFGTLVAAS